MNFGSKLFQDTNYETVNLKDLLDKYVNTSIPKADHMLNVLCKIIYIPYDLFKNKCTIEFSKDMAINEIRLDQESWKSRDISDTVMEGMVTRYFVTRILLLDDTQYFNGPVNLPK